MDILDIIPSKLAMHSFDPDVIQFQPDIMRSNLKNHFAFNTESKQWQRYISKIKNHMLKFYRSTSDILDGNHKMDARTFDEVIASTFLTYMVSAYGENILNAVKKNAPNAYEPMKSNMENSGILLEGDLTERINYLEHSLISHIMNIHIMPLEHLFICNEDLCGCIYRTLSLSLSNEKYKKQLSRLIDEQLNITMQQYVIAANLHDNSITKENFVMKTMPKEFNEIEYLCYDFNNRLFHAIVITASYIGKFDQNAMNDSCMKTLEEENSQLIDAINEIKTLLEQHEINDKNQKAQIENLKNRLSALKEVMLQGKKNEELVEITQKYNKLKKLYESLQRKYENVTKAASCEETNNTEDIVSKLELNTEKRYVFVAHEKTGFVQSIKNAFPNSSIITSANDVFPTNAEIAIVITSHIDHCTRDKVRDICKAKNIPFLHCDNTNINIIKQSIVSHLSNTNLSETFLRKVNDV